MSPEQKAFDFINARYEDAYLLTKKETAGLLRVSSATLDRVLKAGAIPFQKIRGQVFITKENLAAYMAGGQS